MRRRPRASLNANLDLERYAEINAHVRHFPADKRDEVVQRLGVSPRDFRAAAERLAAEMEASAAAGRPELMQLFSTVFARTKRRLASLQPTVESLGPLPEPEAEPEKTAAPDPTPPPAPVDAAPPAEPHVAVPSYMSNTASPAGGPALPAYMKSSSVLDSAPPVPPVAPAPPVAPVPPAAARRPGTLSMPVMAPPSPELPFKPAESPEAAVERAIAHAAKVSPPAPNKPSPAGGQTADISAIVRGPLPFARSARPIPDYSVERYASLKVEVAEYADRVGDVLARYKLDPETHAALDEDWKRRMKADASLHARFLDACERYRGWLRSQAAARR